MSDNLKFRFKKDSPVDDVSLTIGSKQIVCQGKKSTFECSEAEWQYEVEPKGWFELVPEPAPKPEPTPAPAPSPNAA